MNAESAGQDLDVSVHGFGRLTLPHCEIDTSKSGFDDDFPSPYLRQKEKCNLSKVKFTSASRASNPARNKRKNFYPRYTTTSPIEKSIEDDDGKLIPTSTMTSNEGVELGQGLLYRLRENETQRGSPKSPASTCTKVTASGSEVESPSSAHQMIFPPWKSLISHYEQLAKASELIKSNHLPTSSSGSALQAAIPDMAEWMRKFDTSHSAVTAIRELLRTCQDRESDKDSQEEPRSESKNLANISNGSYENQELSGQQSPLNNGTSKRRPSPLNLGPAVEPTDCANNVPVLKQETSFNESLSPTNYRWKGSSGEEDNNFNSKTAITKADGFKRYEEDSSDCDDHKQTESATKSSLSFHHRWSGEEFQEAPRSLDQAIKNECDDSVTTVGETDNNPYDEDDYPASPNDFPYSTNEDDDDDDNYGVNMFCDDEQSTTGGQTHTRSNSADIDENQSLVAEKEDGCSNSSSKISVRNLGGLFDQNKLNLNSSNFLGGNEDKAAHSDFIQKMNKFTSFMECQNEMCRLESLREHYHCYAFPCFGKILSKKEEIIRHVKWHRKRMESLNHGFMRFSSTDDCSSTFGNSCQHNRKQTHYHCFQPNCDRVYISTSDVQMHSNFHRKDSAIHKEGFQRFRANETCSADYCMFAGQKTTHFHCRRENCRYTFKNKADMEKHKTYHIKDLKLARDGFKKFLKNEPCPYRQCRFSKVCNHIHCARENCFYVLHSSGQLLSHKRKHERMDNEQSYGRYKMLAVKAALLNNSATATSSVSSELSPYNLANSLLQLRELELNALIPSTSKRPLLSPQPDFNNKGNISEPVSTAPLSIEFLHQMQRKHAGFPKQNQHNPSDQMRIPQQPGALQHQYNVALDPSQLTPSIIQQFFTTDCPTRRAETDEPINLRSLPSSDDHAQKSPCPWKEHVEPHLHCTVKYCDAVIPNNAIHISAHIQLHGYNRDVYATTAAAAAASSSEPTLSPATGTLNNPMQITTIDGFFNRKRGRPPKNRFVEVYKNAQQSPQAIFTSFKLEKQTMSKDCTSAGDTTPSPLHVPPAIDAQLKEPAEEARLMNLSLSPPSFIVQNTIAPQFTTHKVSECCVVGGSRCPLAMQHHYHCTCSPECTFVTVEKDLLSLHLEHQHTAFPFADSISKKFKRFDRNIGLDCGIADCRLRKTRPHLHCRQCYCQISPFDFETHVCANKDSESKPLSPTMKKEAKLCSPDCNRGDHQLKTEASGESFSTQLGKNISRDFSHLPSVTFGSLNELRKKVSEMEPETNLLSKRNLEDEKILVVRAAGTYFPENTNERSSSTSLRVEKKTPSCSISADCGQMASATPSTFAHSTADCKRRRKPHEYCEYCDQSFSSHGKNLTKAQHYKRTSSSNLGMSGQLGFLQADEELMPPTVPNETHSAHGCEDQPQDLSLSPNPTVDDSRLRASIGTFATSRVGSQVNPSVSHIQSLLPPDIMNSLSMQNFHLAQLATLYQQNPYYYQHLYPFLSNAAALSRHHQHRQSHSYEAQYNEEKQYTPISSEGSKPHTPVILPPASPVRGHFPFLNPLLLRTAETATAKQASSSTCSITSPGAHMPSLSSTVPRPQTTKTLKRKLTNGSSDFNAIMEALSPSTKKQMQFAAGLAAAAAAAAATGGSASGGCRPGEQHGQHFKIKDEQIPTGYLKFRFNEDCYFPKCGYRNHQSHFHCDRNDCHYSFCDKTRFVQHTARHERLDKLMGSDFRQYRANMNCGYENCPYFKNLGSANKSSHFHCLKCDFICSDTNKVVAHRRQHSKMEYIRLAGFRKVTSSEKCNSTFEATVPSNGNEAPGTVECSYSQKQTHYHCLVCDVSVLSRAQLSSHKHKT